MKFYTPTDRYHFKELPVKDIKTNKEYVCYNRSSLFCEDYYTIRRYTITDEFNNNVYEFMLMPQSSSCYCIICDEETAFEIIKNNLADLIKGKLNQAKIFCILTDKAKEYKGIKS